MNPIGLIIPSSVPPLFRFTVLLLRPEMMSWTFGHLHEEGPDVYVAMVEATDSVAAIDVAQAQVWEADTRDLRDQGLPLPTGMGPAKYMPFMMFNEWVAPCKYGPACKRDVDLLNTQRITADVLDKITHF